MKRIASIPETLDPFVLLEDASAVHKIDVLCNDRQEIFDVGISEIVDRGFHFVVYVVI